MTFMFGKMYFHQNFTEYMSNKSTYCNFLEVQPLGVTIGLVLKLFIKCHFFITFQFVLFHPPDNLISSSRTNIMLKLNILILLTLNEGRRMFLCPYFLLFSMKKQQFIIGVKFAMRAIIPDNLQIQLNIGTKN